MARFVRPSLYSALADCLLVKFRTADRNSGTSTVCARTRMRLRHAVVNSLDVPPPCSAYACIIALSNKRADAMPAVAEGCCWH